jgi:hypothetical protein
MKFGMKILLKVHILIDYLEKIIKLKLYQAIEML